MAQLRELGWACLFLTEDGWARSVPCVFILRLRLGASATWQSPQMTVA